jgi:hypothetical protein
VDSRGLIERAKGALMERERLDAQEAFTRKADETIDLLINKVRDRRLAEALKAYTLASQACRQQATP